MKSSYIYLSGAILLSFIGSSMLKISDGFTVFWATALCVITYAISYYFFSVALKKIPLFLGYAIWSAISTVGNFIIGIYIFGEPFNTAQIAAILLIVLGTVLIQKKAKA